MEIERRDHTLIEPSFSKISPALQTGDLFEISSREVSSDVSFVSDGRLYFTPVSQSGLPECLFYWAS
jgi:hypothetical protein